ncbi:MAG: DUF2474 domain-containing protein [Brevundimonas sp. 12-68-7]|uniref:DUF2474 domain-containing protein n=1 Tax=Brevundimonas subvibrioides TaxID=74313 RepID=A0A258FK73_9CAUL|nr:MAG: DUF2474 domain-containing protein [Brevundimonas sp. 12-68-7]OYX32617.1 MAG: DUF2474 domain-containing protein [Brevundimonas subvibrioides]
MPPRLRQGFWFVALWALGVGVLGVVAYLLRAVLTPVLT